MVSGEVMKTIEELEALLDEKAGLLTDKAKLKTSVDDMKAALSELEARRNVAEQRIAEYQSLLVRFKKLIDSGKFEDRELPHANNFLECIESGARPNADIEIGHLSASLCHLGNIATRTGKVINFDPKTEQIVGDPEANKLVGREYRAGHLATPV